MILLVYIILITSLLASKRMFNKTLNPLSLYSFVWLSMVSLYQLKLIKFIDLSTEAILSIALASFALFAGFLVYYFTHKNEIVEFHYSQKKESEPFSEKEEKLLKYIILVCVFFGLVGAIQHWMILLNEFGSIPKILLNLNEVYRMRIDGEIIGVLPYVGVFPYVAVFFSAIYFYKKNKFDYYIIIPQIVVVLRETANVGRAGILMSFVLFIVTIINLRDYISVQKIMNLKRGLGVLFIIVLLVFSASTIKSLRGVAVDHNATSSELKAMRKNFLINPSIYLYTCGHIGTFTKYLEKDYDSYYRFGGTTFRPVYNILAKFNWVDKPEAYAEGYNIPIWINTGSWLTDLHQDFGTLGLLIVPFILGYFSIKYWIRFHCRGTTTDLLFLSYLMLLLIFTFLHMFTKFGPCFLGFFFTLIATIFYDQKIKRI